MKVLKWHVPVDDQDHRIGKGKIVLVACQYDAASVQVWTEEEGEPNLDEGHRLVRVFGTGHGVPAGYSHIGSAWEMPFVWHLYELAE